MYILAIESAAVTSSVAIYKDGTVIVEYTTNVKKTHSQTLLPDIDEIISNAGIMKKDIDCIAVSGGPGSYTGLRIGAAVAKGLSVGIELMSNGEKKVPIISVPTLKALAYNLLGITSKYIATVMDAKGGRLYAGIFSFAKTGTDENVQYVLEEIMDQSVIDIHKYIEKINKLDSEVIFIGDGINCIKEKKDLIAVCHDFAPANLNYPRAGSLAMLAERIKEEGTLLDADEFTPEYFAASQAERELFRELKLQDVESVASIEKEAMSQPWSAESFEEAVTSDNFHFIVCSGGNTLKGYIGLQTAADEACVTGIVVDKEFRRLGIGLGLLKKAIEYCLNNNIEKIFLEVRKSNESAINLYKKCGFVEIGTRKNFYKKPEEDALLMELVIKHTGSTEDKNA